MIKPLGALGATVTAALTAAALLAAPAQAAGPVTIRPAQLERGADVRVPHVEGRAIVDGDVRIPTGARYVDLLGRAGTSYVAVVRKDGRWSTRRFSPGGAEKVLARGTQPGEAVLADGGGQVAVTRQATARRTTIEVLRATDGRRVAAETFAGYASVLDLDGGRAVVGGFELGAVSWNVLTDRTSAITGRATYAADIGSNRLATYTGDPYEGGCTVLSTLDRPGRRLWTSCDERVADLSPNGKRLLTVDILADGIGPGRVWERTARGRRLAAYDAPYYFGQMQWETNRAFVVETYGREQGADVRCSVGSCKRASTLRPTPSI